MDKSPRILFLIGVAASLASPAFAASKNTTTLSDPRVDLLEQQLRDVQQQLAEIKRKPADDGAALSDLKRSTSAHYADMNIRLAAQPRVGMDNGRLTFASADNAFTLSLRSLIQFDYGYFAQGRNPADVDLSSGSNFRRAQFGFFGTAWRDWSYNFTYDFGGRGAEKNGYVYVGFLEYDGLKPLGFRAGAFSTPAGLDDSTTGADLMFLERATAADIAGGIAGAPGREGVSVFAQGDRYLVSVALTGKKTTEGGAFDAQQAIVTRAVWLAVNQSGVKWLLDADFTRVLKPADTAPNSNSGTFSLSNGPELTVDGTKTVDTGILDARNVTEWGLETALSAGPFHGQGGYFHYEIERRIAVPNPDFSGWYALATWSLTGETHVYDPVVAVFHGLKPDKPLGTQGGWGAWELKARYSSTDLDYQPLLGAASGGVAGGVQDIWTVGVNWFPTYGLRFALDYSDIQVNHINAPATDISASAIALRSQVSF
ncbi:MAG TPA: porin [Rhizomicrobium sp.]|nr:porin [Rhizomicrobium sp.]